jgi:hypothetical protein
MEERIGTEQRDGQCLDAAIVVDTPSSPQAVMVLVFYNFFLAPSTFSPIMPCVRGPAIWQVSGSNGDNLLRSEGATLEEALWRVCEQARAVGMLAPARREDDH